MPRNSRFGNEIGGLHFSSASPRNGGLNFASVAPRGGGLSFASNFPQYRPPQHVQNERREPSVVQEEYEDQWSD